MISFSWPLVAYVHRKGLIPSLARKLNYYIESDWLFRLGWEQTEVITGSEDYIVYNATE